MAHMQQMLVASRTLGTVTVSGEAISASSGSGPVSVKLVINTDGTLDKNENGVGAQIDSGTDWIIPNSVASPAYQVRFTNFSGSALAASTTLIEDTWSAIDQNHEIVLIRTGAEGNGQDIASFDLEIRLGTGSTLDSASYTLTAEIT